MGVAASLNGQFEGTSAIAALVWEILTFFSIFYKIVHGPTYRIG